MLPTYIAGTRDHNETLVRCFGAFLLCIPFRRGSSEVHGWVRTVRVDVVVACVFAHVDEGLRTGEQGSESKPDRSPPALWGAKSSISVEDQMGRLTTVSVGALSF